jgi:hypothetical protein
MNMSLKVPFLNYSPNYYYCYIPSLYRSLLQYLVLLSLLYSYDKTYLTQGSILSYISIFPVATYTDTLQQRKDIFKENNKKSGIYR